MRSFTLASLILVVLGTTACGGGGADVAGVRFESPAYWYASMGGDARAQAFSGTLTPLDRDIVQFDIREINDGALLPPRSDAQQYELRDDGALRLLRAPDSADIQGRGGVSDDGTLGLEAGIAADDGVHMGAFVAKPSQPFDPDSIVGTYYHVSLDKSAGGPFVAKSSLTTFDALGMVDRADIMVQTDQPLCISTLPFPYVADTTGKLSMLPGVTPIIGGFNQDASVGIAAGKFATGHDSELHLLVRQASGTSLATLSGEYWIAVLRQEGASQRSGQGIARLDGQGGGELVMSSTGGSDSEIDETTAVGYSVGPTGGVEMDFFSGQFRMRGGVSGDGRVVVLAGSFGPGLPPALAILIRR